MGVLGNDYYAPAWLNVVIHRMIVMIYYRSVIIPRYGWTIFFYWGRRSLNSIRVAFPTDPYIFDSFVFYKI